MVPAAAPVAAPLVGTDAVVVLAAAEVALVRGLALAVALVELDAGGIVDAEDLEALGVGALERDVLVALAPLLGLVEGAGAALELPAEGAARAGVVAALGGAALGEGGGVGGLRGGVLSGLEGGLGALDAHGLLHELGRGGGILGVLAVPGGREGAGGGTHAGLVLGGREGA